MKNTFVSCRHRLVRTVTLIAAALSVCPAIFGAITSAAPAATASAPIIPAVTNQLTIGSPAIIVPPAIAKSLNLGTAGPADTDGAMAAEIIRPPLEHLLTGSGRFEISAGAEAGYKIQAGVAGFKIASDSAATNKASFFKSVTATFKGMFSKSTATNQLGGLDMVGGLNDINWSKDETRIVIQCDASMQLLRLNGQGEELIGGKAGSVFKDMTVKDVRAQMGYFDVTAGGPPVQNKVDFQTWIIGLALHDALTNLMPEIDREAADPHAKVAQAAATIARHHMAGKVVAVQAKDLIVVSLGSVNDVKVGDKLSLFKTTDIMNGAGAVMFTQEVPVGEIKVTSVGETNSTATYPANVSTVKEGWRVRAAQ